MKLVTMTNALDDQLFVLNADLIRTMFDVDLAGKRCTKINFDEKHQAFVPGTVAETTRFLATGE